MNFFRFPARLAQRRLSRAVARTATRRRFAVFSVAVATVLTSVALTAGPASAAGGGPAFCLYADFQQVYPGGAVQQLGCENSNLFQEWNWTFVGTTAYGNVYQLQNYGALVTDTDDAKDCLAADAQQVGDGGAVIQSGCDASDLFQLWLVNDINQTVSIQNYGALVEDHTTDCLDADAQQVYDGGAVIQWGCNYSDLYQLWTAVYTSDVGFTFSAVGTQVA